MSKNRRKTMENIDFFSLYFLLLNLFAENKVYNLPLRMVIILKWIYNAFYSKWYKLAARYVRYMYLFYWF